MDTYGGRACSINGWKFCSNLRKAMVVATKLKIREFRDWIEQELNGYQNENPLSAYRTVHGDVKVWTHTTAEFFPDAAMAESLSKRPVGQPVTELENIIKRSGDKSYLQMLFPKEIELAFNDRRQPTFKTRSDRR